MSPEEHACRIREISDMILRLIASQKYAEIVLLLEEINSHTYDIQTGK